MELANALVVIIAAFVGISVGVIWRRITDKNYLKAKREEAELEKAEIIAQGHTAASLAKKEALLEAKDQWYEEKARIDDEIEQRKERIHDKELDLKARLKDALAKEQELEDKEELLETRESFIATRERTLEAKEAESTRLIELQNEKLERIAHMTKDEAKKILLENLEHEIRYDNADMIKARRDEALETADKEAKEIVLGAIQRCASDYTAESTVSVVTLPNDDMKGRIIGREGRNIRTFEELTGVDVIVDDTPGAVILSCFEPVRREVARMALQELVTDGRIHPGRIEEVIKKSEKELTKIMKEAAEEVIYDLEVHNLKPKIVDMIGRLKYRTSYGQNVLKHSHEVAILAGLIAAELGFDAKLAVRCGLLHDIGKAIDRENEGTHSELGAVVAEKVGENSIVVNAIAAHHEDVAAMSVYPVIVQAADAISSSRPGVRKETLSNYITRLTKLEEIADSFKGINKSYVIQAGREMRVMVDPVGVTDAQAEELARSVAKKIEQEMEYPGQIKVTMIREIRYSEYAK